MLVQLTSDTPSVGNEVHLSYFIRRKRGEASRIASARLLEISEAGLCMEISPLDSDLFLETGGTLFALNKNIEAQIFCRSHPNNVSVEGVVKWFKRNEEIDESMDGGNVCVGVIFSHRNSCQKQEIAELVRHLKNDTIQCHECNARISADAFLCYNCGSKPIRKRALLKKILSGLFNGDDDVDDG